MKYTVEWCETIKEGEKEGRKWKMTKMSLKDEQGVVTTEVTTFDSVTLGGTVEGSIVQNGQYLNFKKALEKPNFMKHKEAQIEKNIERKEQSISRFQDDKEWSIMVSSTMRDAVSLAVAQNAGNFEGITREELASSVLKWREWLLNNWNVDKTDLQAF